MQTEEYARALLKAHHPPLDDEIIEERVAARLERQELLVRKPTAQFGFVIEEITLRRPVGGTEVMKRQLRQLLERGELRNVAIQVLPTSRGAHAGVNGPLVLLETPDHQHFAFVEGQATSMLHSSPGDVSVLARRHAMIVRQALGIEESTRFIREVAEEL
ncbi:DUF5753 domain-containing protein [Streptomyces sp. NPDC004647]|uniref:DUF5753 domain-containing protein n=1 Tax=Streptomyces sp. NPDC004647 TaxID=3154671 RepID=UPI0033A0D8EB